MEIFGLSVCRQAGNDKRNHSGDHLLSGIGTISSEENVMETLSPSLRRAFFLGLLWAGKIIFNFYYF
jgi:hypothetical protein